MNINDEAIRAATAKAIIDTLTTETRDELFQQAIGQLFVPQSRGSYADKTSDFHEAFREAIRRVAVDIAQDELKKPENATRLEQLIAEGVKKALGFNDTDQWNSIQGKIADAVVKGLTGGDRY